MYDLARKAFDIQYNIYTSELKLEGVKRALKKVMEDEARVEFSNKRGTISLKPPGKTKKERCLRTSPYLDDLLISLENCQQTLVKDNLVELYLLQKKRDLANLAIERIINDEEVLGLRDEIKDEEKRLRAEAIKVESSDNQVKIKVHKPKATSLAEPVWINEAVKSAKVVGKSRKHIYKFLENYYVGKQYGDLTVDEALDHYLYS